MRILFYPPFKPMKHPHPSGDLVIATGIYRYLEKRGNQVWTASSLRSRWIFWKPWLLPVILREQQRSMRRVMDIRPDLWLTYHTYYKAPDLLGPFVCARSKIPYVIFQGIFSTKRKRNPATLPGYLLNRKALGAAQHIFTNRKEDLINLERLIPKDRLTYVAPGINPDDFSFNGKDRTELRSLWGVGDDPVVLTAAMFRPGIKTRGISWVIRSCGILLRKGIPLFLAVAGDGKKEPELKQLAAEHLGDRVRFLGKIPRRHMARFYSAGDIFAFPGFRESLGMVFLEAQSCGLPVVACDNGGIPEVVQRGHTAYLAPMNAFDEFVHAMDRLLIDSHLRKRMGRNAQNYIRARHDLGRNYRVMETELKKIIGSGEFPLR